MTNKNRLLMVFKALLDPGLILIIIFIIFVFVDDINSINHQLIGLDEGYNATVAANLVRHGKYYVSYPDYIVFANIITTGPLVILPTALLFKVFGVNNITASIVSLIYVSIGILLIWNILKKCFKNNYAGSILAAVFTALFVLTDKLIPNVSTHLYGEGACFCFIAGACLLLGKGYSSKKNIAFVFAGFLVIASFLTKSSIIFILVALLGIMLFERIIKNVSTANLLSFYGGAAGGFVLLDSYKLYALGSLNNWLQWWRDEWDNMLSQSGQTEEKPAFIEKFDYISNIFGIDKYAALFLIVLPVILYCFWLYLKFRKKEQQADNNLYCVVLCGIAASSLEIYYLLFGGSGLMYPRRHFVNEFFVKLVIVVILGRVLIWLSAKPKNKSTDARYGILLLAMVMVLVFPYLKIKDSIKSYWYKKQSDDYELIYMKELLAEVDELGPDAVLFSYGWWQEPDVTLFLDRKLTDIQDVDIDQLDYNNSYFIVGRRFDCKSTDLIKQYFHIELEEIDNIDVDYEKCYGHNSNELFSIYRIVKITESD